VRDPLIGLGSHCSSSSFLDATLGTGLSHYASASNPARRACVSLRRNFVGNMKRRLEVKEAFERDLQMTGYGHPSRRQLSDKQSYNLARLRISIDFRGALRRELLGAKSCNSVDCVLGPVNAQGPRTPCSPSSTGEKSFAPRLLQGRSTRSQEQGGWSGTSQNKSHGRIVASRGGDHGHGFCSQPLPVQRGCHAKAGSKSWRFWRIPTPTPSSSALLFRSRCCLRLKPHSRISASRHRIEGRQISGHVLPCDESRCCGISRP